jgi:hypothetical protein
LNKEGTECLRHWAGVADHVGNKLTYVVVSNKTGHTMYWSDLRTPIDPKAPNFRAEVTARDKMFKKTSDAHQDTGSKQPIFPSFVDEEDGKHYTFAPEDLLGKVFHEEDEHGNFVHVL